jgi:hypothetical protein
MVRNIAPTNFWTSTKTDPKLPPQIVHEMLKNTSQTIFKKMTNIEGGKQSFSN